MKKLCVFFVVFVFGLTFIVAQESALSPSAETGVAVAVDSRAPIVIIDSPQSIVYNNATPIPVDYTIDDVSHDSTWYWLNDGLNVSSSGNFTLDLAEGNNTLTIYANDSFNRIGFSSVIFSVNNSMVFCGNNLCDASENCSICSVDCGACLEPEPPVSESSSEDSSDDDEEEFELDKTQIKISLKQGESRKELIEIRNTDNERLSFDVSYSFDEDLASLSEDSFFLNSGEVKIIEIKFVASSGIDPGVYLGEIIVNSGSSEMKVVSAIEVESDEALFDVKIEIPEEYLKVFAGESVLATLTIFSLGGEEKVETNVRYEIKSEDGVIIYEGDEEISVDAQTSFVREFPIPSNVEAGRYLLYVPVEYNGKSGSSSQWFEVIRIEEKVEKKEVNFEWLLVLFIVVVATLIVVKTIQQKKHNVKKRKK